MSPESLDQQLSVISTLLVESDATNTSNIASTLDILRRLESSPLHQTQAWKLLADASRDEQWREPFGQGGLVAYSTSVLSDTGTSREEQFQVLRFIGNCCADHDGNRQIVVDQAALEDIGTFFTYSDLAALASTVLFNIFNDYEPAQKASSAALFSQCLTPLTTETIDPAEDAYQRTCLNLHTILQALDIDELATHHESFLLDAVSLFKCVAAKGGGVEDLDDYVLLLNPCTVLLRHGPIREALSTHLELILGIFRKISERLHIVQADATEADNTSILEATSNEFLEALCEIANGPDFLISTGEDSVSWKILQDWLIMNDQQMPEACFTCASLFIGNLARQDAMCESLVLQQELHLPLIKRVPKTKDRRALHAAGGCLRNLAVPPRNKEVIAEAGAFDAIMHMLQINVVQELPYLGACIARQLVNGSLTNVQRLLLRPDVQSPTNAGPPSYLRALLQASYGSDDFAIKAEVARIIAAIFRVLSTPKGSRDRIDQIYKQILSHSDITVPVEAILRQDQSKPLRSEGWFTLALIARSDEGARVVAKVLENNDILGLLRGQMNSVDVEGEDKGDGSYSGASKDRENALVLVTSLLQKAGDSTSETQQQEMKTLLKEQNVEWP